MPTDPLRRTLRFSNWCQSEVGHRNHPRQARTKPMSSRHRTDVLHQNHYNHHHWGTPNTRKWHKNGRRNDADPPQDTTFDHNLEPSGTNPHVKCPIHQNCARGRARGRGADRWMTYVGVEYQISAYVIYSSNFLK